MTDFEFRSRLASTARSLSSIPRSAIFGPAEPQSRPINLQEDAALMFPGYVGSGYQPGGCVLLAINPGGGSDKYQMRTAEDDHFYPIMEAFHRAPSDGALERFEIMNQAWVRNVQRWNLGRIVNPVLDALGQGIEQVTFLNAVPYRTRNDLKPSAHARRQAWTLVTEPLLRALRPGVIVALGQKAGDVLADQHRGTARIFVVQRSIGDTYLTPKALAVLEEIRAWRAAVHLRTSAAG